jgi:hypothetical protein
MHCVFKTVKGVHFVIIMVANYFYFQMQRLITACWNMSMHKDQGTQEITALHYEIVKVHFKKGFRL